MTGTRSVGTCHGSHRDDGVRSPLTRTPSGDRKGPQAVTALDAEGLFEILAIDHRDSLRAVVAPDSPAEVTARDLTAIKLDVLRELAHLASGVMLDPEYGVAPAIGAAALPADTGFMTSLEAQGYLGEPESRETTLLDGWSVDKASRVGADAVKLLIFYHPDAPGSAARQRGVVESVLADCRSADIPMFLEPMLYPLVSGRDLEADRRALVVETARELAPLGADVMKVQFPVSSEVSNDRGEWARACTELHDALRQPWAILTGGVAIDLFADQLEVAGSCGCSGFMAGRAVWGDTVTVPADDRRAALISTARPRFELLCEVARANCQPIERVVAFDTGHSDDWYSTY